ncbi:unnamed protein product [Meloidogyne enterolobii]|uniref:Uncharacterized protein n=1 Tax=Meloidogyne enterolobii TaxID=390850 RepID=A0ACB0XS08_MELEN
MLQIRPMNCLCLSVKYWISTHNLKFYHLFRIVIAKYHHFSLTHKLFQLFFVFSFSFFSFYLFVGKTFFN